MGRGGIGPPAEKLKKQILYYVFVTLCYFLRAPECITSNASSYLVHAYVYVNSTACTTCKMSDLYNNNNNKTTIYLHFIFSVENFLSDGTRIQYNGSRLRMWGPAGRLDRQPDQVMEIRSNWTAISMNMSSN